jgi:DNA polymerase V
MYSPAKALDAPAGRPPAPRPQVNFTATAIDPYELGLDYNDLLVSHPAATFCFRTEGDAMVADGIRSGDLLVVDRSLTPRPGNIVVASIEGRLVIRRITTLNGRLHLTTADTAYPPIPLSGDDDLTIWGVVTWSLHAFV